MPFQALAQLPQRNITEWQKITTQYFDKDTQLWINRILSTGSNFGLNPQNLPRPRVQCRELTKDPLTLLGIAKTVRKWYRKNLISGPYSESEARKIGVTASPAFGVPKPDGSTRPVIDYSNKTPSGQSVNSTQLASHTSVQYVSLKSIIATAYSIGPSAWLWARDLEDGYFNIWLELKYRKYGTFKFANCYWIPNVLMFGFSSAPFIFTKFMYVPLKAIRMEHPAIMYKAAPTKTLHPLLIENEPDIITRQHLTAYPLVRNYLDDIMGVAPTKEIAQQQFTICDKVLRRLGLAPQTKKDKPPSTRIELLGAIVDTEKQRLFLPAKKLTKYSTFITQQLKHPFITKRQLLQIIGRIRYSATFCRPLAAYARNMEVYAHKLTQLSHRRRVTEPLKLDLDLILWGLQHATTTGVSFKSILGTELIEITASTDAAGVHGGIGGTEHAHNGIWFQEHWRNIRRLPPNIDIEWKELAALIVAVQLLQDTAQNKKLRIWCDNLPVVYMVINFRAPLKRPDLQTLLRFLATTLIEKQITLWIDHIDGDKNIIADKLSRFKSNPFRTANWTPNKNPTPVRSLLQHLSDLCF